MHLPSVPQTIADKHHLAQTYASFSRSRAGLGNVLGGVVGLVVFGLVWRLGHSLAVAIVSISLTLLWLVGRTAIRQWLYRPYGPVSEYLTPAQRREHQGISLFITLVLLGFATWLIVGGWLTQSVAWPYLIFCLVTPFVVWRTLFTVVELLLGVDLLFLCAVVASGHTPDLLGLLAAPAYALALIPVGLHEHQQFQVIKQRLAVPHEPQA